MRRYRRHRLKIFFKKFEKAWLISTVSNDAFRTFLEPKRFKVHHFTSDKNNFHSYHSSTRWLATTNDNAKMPSVNRDERDSISTAARRPASLVSALHDAGDTSSTVSSNGIEGRGRRYLLQGLSSKGKGRFVNVTLTSVVHRGRVWGGKELARLEYHLSSIKVIFVPLTRASSDAIARWSASALWSYPANASFHLRHFRFSLKRNLRYMHWTSDSNFSSLSVSTMFRRLIEREKKTLVYFGWEKDLEFSTLLIVDKLHWNSG